MPTLLNHILIQCIRYVIYSLETVSFTDQLCRKKSKALTLAEILYQPMNKESQYKVIQNNALKSNNCIFLICTKF